MQLMHSSNNNEQKKVKRDFNIEKLHCMETNWMKLSPDIENMHMTKWQSTSVFYNFLYKIISGATWGILGVFSQNGKLWSFCKDINKTRFFQIVK